MAQIFIQHLQKSKKINVSALYDKINNYVDSRDLVGLGYKKGEGTVGKTYNFSGESNGINKIDQHMWGGYRFDSDGNLIDEDGKRVKAWNKPDEIKKLQAEAKDKVRDAAINKVQGLSVDVDHDGKLDAQFGRDKLLTTELMPGSGAGKDIVINFSSLQGLSKNLQGLLEDIKQIRELLTKSTTTNSTVESRKANRTETLEQSIVSYLEQINLIKSIKNLDDFYTKLEDKADVEYINIELGGSENILNYYHDLVGQESRMIHDIAYLGNKEQKFDISMVMSHGGKKSYSDIHTLGALSGNSKKSFRGTLDFLRGAVASEGAEEDTCLLLDPTVKSISLPLLLCKEDNVVGNHAASAGQIDHNKLFYIMSRGFSEVEAKHIIVESMIRPIIDRIGDETIEEAALAAVRNKNLKRRFYETNCRSI